MKTTYRKLLWLSPILCLALWFSPAGAGVNCDGVPHTRLELAICGEPVLRALDGELTAALQEARERGNITKQAVAEQRNRIARQCRREASRAFNACLLDAELKSLEWVASKLGQSNVLSASVNSKSWRYDASHAARTSQLQRQLQVAENRLRSTADPELTVVTILELIRSYKDQTGPRDRVAKSMARLERRLASGCDHLVYGAEWRLVLSENNLSCKDPRAPALFSSSEL